MRIAMIGGVERNENAYREIALAAGISPRTLFRYIGSKEELLLGVLDKCPSLTLVGGGAAHAAMEDPTSVGHVHADGEVETDAP